MPKSPVKSPLLDQIDQLRAAVEQLVQDAEIGRRMREMMDGDAFLGARVAPSVAAKANGRLTNGVAKRSNAKVSSETLVAALKASGSDGLSLGELVGKLGGLKKSRVATALRKLRDTKQVKVVGEKRAARWFAT